MTEYRASVKAIGKPHRLGPYHLERLIYTDSDGSSHKGWRAWSGNFDFGTGHRGALPGVLLLHWRHMCSLRKRMHSRGLDIYGFPRRRRD